MKRAGKTLLLNVIFILICFYSIAVLAEIPAEEVKEKGEDVVKSEVTNEVKAVEEQVNTKVAETADVEKKEGHCGKNCKKGGCKGHHDKKERLKVKGCCKKYNPTLWFKHQFALSYFPLGVRYHLDAFKRWYLFDSESVLFKKSHLDIGLSEEIAPTYNLIGAYLNIEPIAVFSLRAQLDYGSIGMIGGKENFYSFLQFKGDDAGADYSYKNRKKQTEDVSEADSSVISSQKNGVLHALFKPVLKMKVGKFIAVNATTINYWDVPDFKGLWYEYTSDMLHEEKGWDMINDSLLIYEVWDEKSCKNGSFLRVGLYNRYVKVFKTEMNAWKLGGAVQWQIAKQWSDSKFEKPTLTVITTSFLEDAIADEDAKRPMWLAILFQFNTNLDK